MEIKTAIVLAAGLGRKVWPLWRISTEMHDPRRQHPHRSPNRRESD